jgi:hypothetical protein
MDGFFFNSESQDDLRLEEGEDHDDESSFRDSKLLILGIDIFFVVSAEWNDLFLVEDDNASCCCECSCRAGMFDRLFIDNFLLLDEEWHVNLFFEDDTLRDGMLVIFLTDDFFAASGEYFPLLFASVMLRYNEVGFRRLPPPPVVLFVERFGVG